MTDPAVQHGTSTRLLPLPAAIAISIVLFAGLLLTAHFFTTFRAADETRLTERVSEGLNTLAAYSAITFENPIQDEVTRVLHGLKDAVNDNGRVTVPLIERMLWQAEDPVFGNAHLLHLTPIASGIAAGQELSAESRGTDPDTVGRDAGSSPGYSVALDVAHDGLPALGESTYSDPTFRLVMNQARDTGTITSRTSFPMTEEAPLLVITHYFLPLYAVSDPVDINQRRETHTGFLSAVLSNDISVAAPFMPDSYFGLETLYFPQLPPGSGDTLAPELRELITNGTIAVREYTVNGTTSSLGASASLPLQQAFTTLDRWWAVGGGSLLTLWICALIYWNYSRSREAVDQSLAALAERSRALGLANEALRTSEARYRMLAENVSDMIFTHDLEGICEYVSPSCEKLTGYTSSELIGRPVYGLFQGPSYDSIREGIQATVERLQTDPLADVSHHPFLFEITCREGSNKWIETSVNILRDRQGHLTGFLGVARDVTVRVSAEEEQQHLEASYRQALKMEAIGKLAGGIAHDFNNLLTGILGHTEILKLDRSIRPDARQSINVIETAAMRARELTNQLLGFARKGQYRQEVLVVEDMLQELFALLEHTLDTRITLSSRSDGSTPSILGDSGQLTRVLLNLAVNARDAMPDGGTLTFSTRTVDLDMEYCRNHISLEPGRFCHIAVSDTGKGIAPGKMEHVFEPFFTDKEKGKGTGMGLAIAYSVIRHHGGAITLNSTEGTGTTFDIYLPWHDRVTGPVPASTPTTELNSVSRTILVVDDEEIIVSMATIMLERLGYEAAVARDSNTAVTLFRKQHRNINLVILDVAMPHTDGLSCLQQLRQIDPGVKVVIASGFSDESLSDRFNELQIAGFLGKPFRLQELAETVARALDGHTEIVPAVAS